MTAPIPPTLRVFGGVGAAGASGEIDLGGPKQRGGPGAAARRAADRGLGRSHHRHDLGRRRPGPRRGVGARATSPTSARPSPGADPIEFRDRGYVLDVPPESIDLHRFEQTVDQGRELLRAGQLPEARERLAQAVDLSAERPFGALADELHLDQVIAAIDQRRARGRRAAGRGAAGAGRARHDRSGPARR